MIERGVIDLYKNLLSVGETAYLLGVTSDGVRETACCGVLRDLERQRRGVIVSELLTAAAVRGTIGICGG